MPSITIPGSGTESIKSRMTKRAVRPFIYLREMLTSRYTIQPATIQLRISGTHTDTPKIPKDAERSSVYKMEEEVDEKLNRVMPHTPCCRKFFEMLIWI